MHRTYSFSEGYAKPRIAAKLKQYNGRSTMAMYEKCTDSIDIIQMKHFEGFDSTDIVCYIPVCDSIDAAF
jgi:hypothetical protein